MTTSQKRAIGYAIRRREENDRRTFLKMVGIENAFELQKRYKTTRGFIRAVCSGRIVIHPETGLAVTPRTYKPI